MQLSIEEASIHHDAAHAALAAAARKAAEMGVNVAIVVVDRGSRTVATLRMSGTAWQCIDIATDKAATAVGFGMPTSAWGKVLPTLPPEVQAGLPGRRDLAMFGGGVPIQAGDRRIGAIGVSGASDKQDEEIALAAIAAIGAK